MPRRTSLPVLLHVSFLSLAIQHASAGLLQPDNLEYATSLPVVTPAPSIIRGLELRAAASASAAGSGSGSGVPVAVPPCAVNCLASARSTYTNCAEDDVNCQCTGNNAVVIGQKAELCLAIYCSDPYVGLQIQSACFSWLSSEAAVLHTTLSTFSTLKSTYGTLTFTYAFVEPLNTASTGVAGGPAATAAITTATITGSDGAVQTTVIVAGGGGSGSSSSSSSGLSTGVIVGIALGSFLFAVLLCGLLVLIWRCAQRREAKKHREQVDIVLDKVEPGPPTGPPDDHTSRRGGGRLILVGGGAGVAHTPPGGGFARTDASHEQPPPQPAGGQAARFPSNTDPSVLNPSPTPAPPYSPPRSAFGELGAVSGVSNTDLHEADGRTWQSLQQQRQRQQLQQHQQFVPPGGQQPGGARQWGQQPNVAPAEVAGGSARWEMPEGGGPGQGAMRHELPGQHGPYELK